MKKQELVRDLKNSVSESRKTQKAEPGFMNQKELSDYMRMRKDTVRKEILEGLEYVETGREKKYHIPDIADRIIAMRRM